MYHCLCEFYINRDIYILYIIKKYSDPCTRLLNLFFPLGDSNRGEPGISGHPIVDDVCPSVRCLSVLTLQLHSKLCNNSIATGDILERECVCYFTVECIMLTV